MNLTTALERNTTIQNNLGGDWKMNVIRLPDDSNVSATWTKGKWHVSCSLFDDTEFHFSVCFGTGISFVGTDKNPALAAWKARKKARLAFKDWAQEMGKLSKISD